MRTRLATALFVCAVSSGASAQFMAPLPTPVGKAEVRREDFRETFISALTQSEKASVATSSISPQVFEQKRLAFCSRDSKSTSECLESLRLEDVEPVAAGNAKKITNYPLKLRLPFWHHRSALAEYMRQSKVGEGLSIFSQFAANVSDEEAFVITNVVRGLAGRAIFSTDYAAVVAKSDESDPAKRKLIESDKVNVIRMVNNGGTLVARMYGPMYAESGSTVSSTAGINFGLGLIGPIGDTDKLHGSGSATAEFMGSIAIRDINGSADQTAELLFGFRGGAVTSDSRLIGGTEEAKSMGFAQFAIGLRKNGEMSLSVLITKTKDSFQDLVPKLQVNFAALR